MFGVGVKIQCLILELICVALVIGSIPFGAHGTVVGVCLFNLLLLAWFWYNLVRSVEVTAEGTLRFWIGNIEVDVPFDKIVSIRRVSTAIPFNCFMVTNQPYRGFLSTPSDGVAISTTVPSTLFWLWPRSAGKPERTCCFMSCPRLTVVFSPAGGSIPFIREVENEMRNFTNTGNLHSRHGTRGPTTTRASNPDYLDV